MVLQLQLAPAHDALTGYDAVKIDIRKVKERSQSA